MTDLADLLAVIKAMEIQLHQPVTRSNIAAVSELLHDDVEEIGRSGQCYDKRNTLMALQIESGQTTIFSDGFKLAQITEGLVLLTYRSFHRSAEGSMSRNMLRSSGEDNDRWQIRFHQGTPVED
ncbi:DUF4440 domain-containing protein [Serratia sp. NPDC078593]|uniref:nuclear transport factor 2 family protein n=1 Tax=unclassified Serratia (in: enterobacteria) TaxID=2647522 RepID=UPI0037CEE1A9